MSKEETKPLVDKLGQEIVAGMWVIKPEDMSFVVGRVVDVKQHTFTYEYTYSPSGRVYKSLCKIPNRCLVVPEIVANYWTALK